MVRIPCCHLIVPIDNIFQFKSQDLQLRPIHTERVYVCRMRVALVDVRRRASMDMEHMLKGMRVYVDARLRLSTDVDVLGVNGSLGYLNLLLRLCI